MQLIFLCDLTVNKCSSYILCRIKGLTTKTVPKHVAHCYQPAVTHYNCLCLVVVYTSSSSQTQWDILDQRYSVLSTRLSWSALPE